jgi:hypothetical protein
MPPHWDLGPASGRAIQKNEIMKRSRLTLQFERAQFPENQQKLQNIDASNERHHASEALVMCSVEKG